MPLRPLYEARERAPSLPLAGKGCTEGVFQEHEVQNTIQIMVPLGVGRKGEGVERSGGEKGGEVVGRKGEGVGRKGRWEREEDRK